MCENSGFSEKMFEEEVEAKYKCPLCLSIIKEPVQTPCGHLFGRSCITESISKFDAVCPIDNTSLAESELRTDEAVKRELSLLKVKCPNQGYGCGWEGTLGQFEVRHQKQCPFFPSGMDCRTRASPVEHQE